MANVERTDERVFAASIASRLQDRSKSIPAQLKPSVGAFLAVQQQYESKAKAADSAETARTKALKDVSDADALLDAAVDKLVNALPAAGLGTRLQPLKGFTSLNPTQLKALPYAKEPDEVASVVAKIAAKKPPASVTSAGKACLAAGTKVKSLLKEYGKKQSAYVEALEARDLLLPDLMKAQKSLKTQAAAAWESDPATLKAVFAPPARVEAPKPRRKKKSTATGGAPQGGGGNSGPNGGPTQ